MRNTVVVSDDHSYGKPPAATSFVRTLLCGAPLFSDPKCRPSGKLKSAQFCNYMPLTSHFKEDKMEASAQESSAIASNIHKNQPSVLVKMYQDGYSGYRSSTKHYFSGSEQKRNEFTVEVNHRLAAKSDFYELDHVQQYYEKLMCQLTMSNSTLMRENQRHQIRFKQLRMLLEDHIDHLNNIYFTLFLNGFSAIQFPDDNGSFTDISNIKTFTEGMETKQNMDVSLTDSGQSSRNFLISKENDDIEGYLQWMNGQTTIW
ncbi:hypothetical protein WUBG_06511 [Wuchereria bancrofti]|uniref:Uncharacterized protein n=1 Tax=Wuchereria bancrofti TaxID=6293 RepID=J9EZG3_WUCBA|nr:hypothetical protein WUBG_06511 [Wuchereria bancrofti]